MKKKNNMGFKNITLLFLIIFAALFSTSFAGRVPKSVELKEERTAYKGIEESWEALHLHHEGIHERVLKVKTNDYGKYDPAPAFVKPPFKLIPN